MIEEAKEKLEGVRVTSSADKDKDSLVDINNEVVQHNKMLQDAVRVGHENEDLAIGTKVNLQGQTDQSKRINDMLIEMQDRDIKESDNLLGQI